MKTNIKSGIYCISNSSNGKKYVGSAVYLKRRWTTHIRELENQTHTNKKLQNAWNKSGRYLFVFSVLEYIEDKQNLVNREQFWINSLDSVRSGYNLCPTAGNKLGCKTAAETKAKLSAINTGKIRSAETIENMRAAQKGRIITAEHRAKISAANKGKKLSEERRLALVTRITGRPCSPETRRKISEAQIGKIISQETRAKMSAAWAYKRQQKELSL